jgi:phenylacetate-CoA ligase
VLGPDAASPDVDLASLPTLSKETLVERFDDLVTDRRLRLADVEAHLAGPDAAEPLLGAYRVFSTSGTTGLRGLMVFDLDDMATGSAVSLRAIARQGVGPQTRLVAIGSPNPLHLSRQVFAAF